MPLVPAGLIAGDPTGGAIPGGWELAVEMIDRHPKGAAAGADPGVNGGAATHEHFSPGVHTGSSHQHTGGSVSNPPFIQNYWKIGADGPIPQPNHQHTVPTTGLATHSLLATALSPWVASSNDPSYVTVRWMRSLGTASGIPVGWWVWWDAAVLPSGWSSPAAARGVFLKGAAEGAVGGGTGGSLAAHSHAGQLHDHPFANHAHTGGTSGSSTTSTTIDSGGTSKSSMSHTHPVTIAQGAAGGARSGTATSAATGSQATGGPPFTTLGVIQNDNAGPSLPIGIIGAWQSLLTALPLSLRLCDGGGGTFDTRGLFVKGATLSGANFTGLGTLGGATTHDHGDPVAHSHNAAHQHVATLGQAAGSTLNVEVHTLSGVGWQHLHPSFTMGSAGGTSGSAAATVDPANHEPLNRTTLFVKYTGAIDVTITSPAADAELAAPTLALAWTLSAGTQVSERLRIYAADMSTLLYDSGTIADTTPGISYSGNALSNGEDYYALVSVVNNAGLPGEALLHFTTAWTPPAAPTGLVYTELLEPFPGGGLEWDAFEGDGELLRTLVYRRIEGGEWEYVGASSGTTFDDFRAESAVAYEYGVAFEVGIFGDVVEGTKALVDGEVRWVGLAIHDAGDPDSASLLVPAESYEVTPEQEVGWILARNRQAPTPVYGERQAHRLRVTLSSESVYVPADWLMLRELQSRQRSLGATYVVRPGTGGWWFMNITSLVGRDEQTVRRLEVEFQEVHYSEDA